MTFRPRTIIGTSSVGSVGYLGPQLRRDGYFVAQKQLGIVIDRLFQLLITVVKGWLTLRRRVKVHASLQLLQPRAREFERGIVRVVDHDLDGLLSATGERHVLIFRVNLLSASHHVHTADLSGADPPSPFVLNVDSPLKIRSSRIHCKYHSFD